MDYEAAQEGDVEGSLGQRTLSGNNDFILFPIISDQIIPN